MRAADLLGIHPTTLYLKLARLGARGVRRARKRLWRRAARLPLLRYELLFNIAVLATGALMLAVTSALVFTTLSTSRHAALYLTGLILGDVAILVLFGNYLVRRLVIQPLEGVVAATEAIAGGELMRRVPAGTTVELARLASSVNRMTTRLIEEQSLVVRAEKMASVGRLAAGVAHEIGNPLGAINGYIHIARKRAASAGGAAADALDGIERECLRIDRIVRGLLEYARPRRATPAVIDINGCVRRALDLLRDQGTLKQVSVDTTLDSGAPTLSGDRHEMEQVLVNLLLNAVDAMSGTGHLTIVTRTVSLAALRDGAPRRAGDPEELRIDREPTARVRTWLAASEGAERVLQVLVADSGPGVPASDADRIFDPFFTTKEPGQGTGLGLSIVARVVENLRGVIWVRKAREGGAAFVMMFPLPKAGSAGAVSRGGIASVGTGGPSSTHEPSRS